MNTRGGPWRDSYRISTGACADTQAPVDTSLASKLSRVILNN
jgi:hypothetical protein